MAGLILAGGEGSRYGGPKAWARLPDGRSFLEACAATLIGAGARPVVATLPPSSQDPGIEGLSCRPLPRAGLDMFAALRLGLEALLGDTAWHRVAILPVDHPLVRPGTVSALASAGSRAVIPRCDGERGHPVVVARDVADGVVDGRFSGPTLRDVLAATGAHDVAVDDPGVVANCNTPEALHRALVTGDQLR